MTPDQLQAASDHLDRGIAAQGLPFKISDPVLMARIAALIRQALAQNAASAMSDAPARPREVAS
jgi:hypothetical protein